ncbi:hypothetical protein [Pandoraea sp. NPDC090278]|uniref:hypothetical protein n=1 Tax=Pandoraea sp. NPDC090278 TaxID=3364391 RepID=UPI00383B89F2
MIENINGSSTVATPPISLMSAEPGNSESDGVGAMSADLIVMRPIPLADAGISEGESRGLLGLPAAVEEYWVYDKNRTQYETFKDDFKQAINLSVNNYCAEANEKINSLKSDRETKFEIFERDSLNSVIAKRGELKELEAKVEKDVGDKKNEMIYEIKKYTSNLSPIREVLIREMLCRIDEKKLNGKLDGLEYMVESFGAEFKEFPPEEYRSLLLRVYEGWETRLDGLVYFSSKSKCDARPVMLDEISIALKAALEGDEHSTREGDLRFRKSLEKFLEYCRGRGVTWEQEFFDDVFFGIKRISEEYRLTALMKYCDIAPENIKKIPQSRLHDFVCGTFSDAERISEAFRCLGEATGCIFLPDDLYVTWQKAAAADPTTKEGRIASAEFVRNVEGRVSKIVDIDGRKINDVYREIILGLSRIDDDLRLNSIKLICRYFSENLSDMFSEFGPSRVCDLIYEIIPKHSVDDAMSEFSKVNGFDQYARLVGEFVERLRKVSSEFNGDEYYFDYRLRRRIENIVDDLLVVSSGREFTVGRRMIYALNMGSDELNYEVLRLIVDHIPGLREDIQLDEIRRWVGETFKIERYKDRVLDLFTPPPRDDEIKIERVKQEMWEASRISMRRVRTIEIPNSFFSLTETEKQKVVKLTVDWIFSPVNSDTSLWLYRFSSNRSIQSYLMGTVSQDTLNSVKQLRDPSSLLSLIQDYWMAY